MNFCDYVADSIASRNETRCCSIARRFGATREDERRGAGRGTAAPTWNVVIYRPNACTDLLSQELTPGCDPAVRLGTVLMSDGAFPLMSGAHVARIIATFARSHGEFTRSLSPRTILPNESLAEKRDKRDLGSRCRSKANSIFRSSAS